MSDAPIKHLLIPGEFKVYCLPNRLVGNLNVTNKPSKCTCANCISSAVYKKTGKSPKVKVASIPGRAMKQWEDNSKRCAVCGGRIYQESTAEGYSCKQCGSSDSDE